MSNIKFLWIVYLACWPVSIILTLVASASLFLVIKDVIKHSTRKSIR